MSRLDDAIEQGDNHKLNMPTPKLGKHTPMPRRQQADLVKLDNALVISDSGVITFRGFELSGAGVEFKDNASEKDMMDLLKILVRLQDRAKMLIADALAQSANAGWRNVAKYADALGVEAKTMSNAISAMRGVPFSLRREVLSLYSLDDFEPSISHYSLLQGFDEDDQRKYLHATMQDKLSVNKLYKLIYGKQKSSRATKDDRYTSTVDEMELWLPKQTKKKQQEYAKKLRRLLKLIEGE